MRRRVSAVLVLVLLFALLSGCAGKVKQAEQSPLEAAARAVSEGQAPDFAALQALNPDIIAWLSIPGAGVSVPVLQSAEDDDTYLSHAADGSENPNGAVFSESAYNAADFSDPVTVLYGSNESDALFGGLLRSYVEPGGLEQCKEILLFTPEGLRTWRAIGASCWSNRHILGYYLGFRNPGRIPEFTEAVKRYHTMTRVFDESVTVTKDDRLLVLSTHVDQLPDQRFLVLAIPAEPAG